MSTWWQCSVVWPTKRRSAAIFRINLPEFPIHWGALGNCFALDHSIQFDQVLLATRSLRTIFWSYLCSSALTISKKKKNNNNKIKKKKKKQPAHSRHKYAVSFESEPLTVSCEEQYFDKKNSSSNKELGNTAKKNKQTNKQTNWKALS